MKSFLPTLAGLFLTYNSYAQLSLAKAQDPRITQQWNHTSIATVKTDIERITGYTFWLPPEVDFLVTLSVENKPLKKVLEAIFYPQGYDCTIIDNGIAIKKLAKQPFTLKGLVINKNGEPVDATLTVKGTLFATITDTAGRFSITFSDKNFILVITAVNCHPQEKRIRGDTSVKITMEPNISNLAEVSVTSSRTSRTAPPQKDTLPPGVPNTKTGSVFTMSDSLLHNIPTQNLMERLRSITGVISLNSNIPDGSNQSPITIRSRITINGDPHILVILNGFPYKGDISQINPNDIESITIVKDAAASTQLGLHAGNGVIMITTKSSSYKKRATVTVTANITVGMKPDLYYVPYMSAKDHINITRFLYDNGYYDNLLTNAPWSVIPPAVAIMYQKKLGLINDADFEEALTNLRNTDIRKESRKYLYQKSLRHQYFIAAQGGSNNHHYYFSVGYDINKSNLIGNSDSRFTINLNNTFKTGRKGPEINSNIYFSQSIIHNNGIDISNFLYPNEKLADGQGNSLPVTRSLNQTYKDSNSNATSLLDWNYKPLDEIKNGKNRLTKTALHLSLGLKYNILKHLDVNASYRHETEISEYLNQHTLQSYFTRDLINQFTQIDSGRITHPVPLGAIIDKNIINRDVNNLSAQLKYNPLNNESNSLIFSAGTEIRHLKYNTKIQRDYGVIQNVPSSNIDYTAFYSTPYEPGIVNQIPKIDTRIDTIEHFYGIFANGVYTWKNKLTASISYRKDESNIFGVQANLKEVPLISAGISWDLSRERFYHLRRSSFRLRLSSGYCSNASRSLSSFTGLQSLGINPWNAPVNTIVNPPNPRLSWETVRISNIGMDFSLFNNRVWGTTEFFTKQGNNLLGMAPIDPTSGVAIFQGNVAAMTGYGLEVALNTKIGRKYFQWQSTVLTSYVKDKVTDYSIFRPSIWYYCDPRYLNPLPGKPLYAMYSLSFKGLDASNGDPIGYHNDSLTNKYNTILQSSNLSELIYHGSSTPTFYGSFHNSFTWKRFELGFSILWKAGYYIRASSINYNAVMNGESIGHSDFTNRWKAPGDERNTNIPSLRYPVDYSRDLFFNYSSALVEKGDHIRLQDIRLKYHVNKKQSSKLLRPLSELYAYANNIGLLWKANNKGIDPDYANTSPMPVNITIGIKAEF